ncbi:hypothetical protein, variant [Verruconis gallopava]|uniref:MARVEL domain-containing protein n=1 Tax=Verruconis gallopava TaxID=253628 RepID=A0A0D2A3G8_9PEZI|nr:uncharacterized protein PV09_07136 [Verruconis gallopava]XP_016211237.1 hypothetical protein, variant [Verruconis gallopava]KIW01367.1 hypothetical protein PV09_07136 [Verruconis gallopava]KIW01368.1 hypothetical protein, variant [Verruconis gallopava]
MSIRKVLESQPFLIAANVLAGILSIVVIGLVADNLAWLRTADAKTGVSTIGFNITVNNTETFDTARVAHLPVDVRTGSYWLMLAAGIGGFIDAVLLGAMQCWRRLKNASLQVEHGETYDRNLKPQTPLSIFIAVFALCRSLAATIYAFHEWAASGTFTPQEYLPLTSNDRYDRDFFTPDAWNCQYEDYVLQNSEQNRLQNLCQEGTAARTVTLAVCVLYAFVAYGVIYRAYKRRQNAKRSVQFRGFEGGGSGTMRSYMSDAQTVVAEGSEPKTPEK